MVEQIFLHNEVVDRLLCRSTLQVPVLHPVVATVVEKYEHNQELSERLKQTRKFAAAKLLHQIFVPLLISFG